MSFNLSKYALNTLWESISVYYHEKAGVCCYALGPGDVTTPGSENHPGEIWKQSKTFFIFTKMVKINTKCKNQIALTDDPGICGGFCVWLTSERRDWLSGRYVIASWDVEKLEANKDDIIMEDNLKFRMVV